MKLRGGTTIRIAPDEEGTLRYLFSYDISNTQPTSGIVYSYRRAFALRGNSSKRVTFIWEAFPTNTNGLIFSVNTGLSLNRGPIGFFSPTQNIPIDESILAEDRIEDSAFEPDRTGIVVDDLDPGFVVRQPEPFLTRFQFAPRDWFYSKLLVRHLRWHLYLILDPH